MNIATRQARTSLGYACLFYFLLVFSILNIVIVILFKNSASAAAWTRNKGELWTSYDYSISASTRDYFTGGIKSNSKNHYTKKEQNIYGEYGLTDQYTLGIKLTRQSINSTTTLYSDKFNGTEYITVSEKLSTKLKNEIYGESFLRRELYDDGKNVFSGFLLYGYPLKNEGEISKRFNFRNTRKAIELGATYGYTIDKKSLNGINGYEGFYPDTNHFVNLQISYRKLLDAFFDEMHIDASLGIKMNSSSMILFEVFHTYSIHSKNNGEIGNIFKKITKEEAIGEGQIIYDLSNKNNYSLINNNTKLKLSSVVKFSEKTSVQLSTFKTFSSIGRELGFNLGLWYKF